MSLNEVVTENDINGLQLLINDKFCGFGTGNVSYKRTEDSDKSGFSPFKSSYADIKNTVNEEKLNFGIKFPECGEENIEIEEGEDNFLDQSITDKRPAYGEISFVSEGKLKQSSPQQNIIDFVKEEIFNKNCEINTSNYVQEEKCPILSIFFDNKHIKCIPHEVQSPAIEKKSAAVGRNNEGSNPLKRRCTDVQNSVVGKKFNFESDFLDCSVEDKESRQRLDGLFDQGASGVRDKSHECTESLFATQQNFQKSSPHQNIFDFVKEEIEKNYEMNMSNQEEEKSPILSVFFDNKPINYVAPDVKAQYQDQSRAIEEKNAYLERGTESFNHLKRRCTDAQKSKHGKKRHLENDFLDCNKDKESRERLNELYDQSGSGTRDKLRESTESLSATQQSFQESSPYQSIFDFAKEEIEKKNYEMNMSTQEEEKSPILSVFFDSKPKKYSVGDVRIEHQVPLLANKEQNFYQAGSIVNVNENLTVTTDTTGSKTRDNKEFLNEEETRSAISGNETFSPLKHPYSGVKENVNGNKLLFINNLLEYDDENKEARERVNEFCEQRASIITEESQATAKYFFATEEMICSKETNPQQSTEYEEISSDERCKVAAIYEMKELCLSTPETSEENNCTLITFFSDKFEKYVGDDANIEHQLQSSALKEENFLQVGPMVSVNYVTDDANIEHQLQSSALKEGNFLKDDPLMIFNYVADNANMISQVQSPPTKQKKSYQTNPTMSVTDDANIEHQIQSSALKEENFLIGDPLMSFNYVADNANMISQDQSPPTKQKKSNQTNPTMIVFKDETINSDNESKISVGEEFLIKEQTETELEKKDLDNNRGFNLSPQCVNVKDNEKEKKLLFDGNFLECSIENVGNRRGLNEFYDQSPLSVAEKSHGSTKNIFSTDGILKENSPQQSTSNEEIPFDGKSCQAKKSDFLTPTISEETNDILLSIVNDKIKTYVTNDINIEHQVQSQAIEEEHTYQICPMMSDNNNKTNRSHTESKISINEEFRSDEKLTGKALNKKTYLGLLEKEMLHSSEHRNTDFTGNITEKEPRFENQIDITSMQYVKENEIMDILNMLCTQCISDNINTPRLESCGNLTNFAEEILDESAISNTDNNSESCTNSTRESNENDDAANFVASKIHKSTETLPDNLRNFTEHEKNTKLKTLANETMASDIVHSSIRVDLTEQVKEQPKSSDLSDQFLASNESNVNSRSNDVSDKIKKRNAEVSFLNDEVSEHDSKRRLLETKSASFNFCELSPTEYLKKSRKRRRKPIFNKKSNTSAPAVPDLSLVIEEFIKDFITGILSKSLSQEQGFSIDDLIQFIEERNPSVSHFAAIHASRNNLLKYTKTGTLKFQNGKYVANMCDIFAQSTTKASPSSEIHAPSTSGTGNYLKAGRHRRAKLQAVKMIKANDAGRGSLAIGNTFFTEGSDMSEDIELISLSSEEE